jgi:hypothetical protein
MGNLAVGTLGALVPVRGLAGETEQSLQSVVPPKYLARLAITQLNGDRPGLLQQFGRRVLRLSVPGKGGHPWLLPVQHKNGDYCVFSEIDDTTQSAREITSFEGCRIRSVKFADLDGDGALDALYELRVKSNRYDVWVDEEVLFLRSADRSGFCQSDRTPKFSSNTQGFVDASAWHKRAACVIAEAARDRHQRLDPGDEHPIRCRGALDRVRC